MGLRSVYEPIPDGERHFMAACITRAIETGELPVTVRNFAGNTKKGGG